MTECAGITIIVDEGPDRTIINIPKAESVEMFTREMPLRITPANLFDAVDDPFWSRPPDRIAGLLFRPIGDYTIREEPNPMYTSAPALSEREQAEVDRFGIHAEDERGGVW
ncbi:hypothetical protein [Microbacterium sp. H6]|uniref:hypothetical protein n=1 Tax=Microbacterium sp. H6 TaxID=421122 RepID=UPI000DE27C91|nr:hypothetical protein [Microbacterium sp. H6]RBO73501.1 hypothetical protein DSP71_04920 [Microbacterium sp. H6]